MRSPKPRNFALAAAVFCLIACCGALMAQKSSGSRGVDLESELPADAHHLKIGDPAPDFSLKGVDGKTYTLADFKDAPVLIVAFLSNHCPYSHAAETRLLPIAADFKSKGLAVVAINPNSPDAISIGELGYSKYSDSYEEMKLYAREQGFSFPYLYDGQTQSTAKAYGCLCTPHVFLFDRERHLRYMGRVDDSRYADPATVKSPDARNAVEALLAGKAVPVEVTKPMGCSTKWLEKKSQVAQIEEQWSSAAVTLESIDAAGVAALSKNPTSKLRLINVWATWCGPCVAEFPGLVSISRRLANRDFELITISADETKDQAKVKEFLEKEHASVPNRVQRSLQAEGRGTNNYQFSGGADLEALLRALDPQAPGPVPYSIVVAPGGKIIYRQAGEVDMPQLQAKVIETLGAYYPTPGGSATTTPATPATPKTSPTLGAKPPSGAVVLFDGQNLDAWAKKAGKEWLKEDGPARWKLVEGGAMEVVPGSDCILTHQTFGDCHLHVEFRTLVSPTNSGVFLQDRYEVNINESYGKTEGTPNGGLDNCTENTPPKARASLPPLAWQTFDIDFVAPRFDASGKKTANARATVQLNGVTIYQNQELQQPHGAASRLGEAPTGPLMLQEHGMPVQFRNIWLVETKKS